MKLLQIKLHLFSFLIQSVFYFNKILYGILSILLCLEIQGASLRDEDPTDTERSRASSVVVNTEAMSDRESVLSDHASDNEELRALIREARELGFSADADVKRALREKRHQQKIAIERKREDTRAAFLARISNTGGASASMPTAEVGAALFLSSTSEIRVPTITTVSEPDKSIGDLEIIKKPAVVPPFSISFRTYMNDTEIQEAMASIQPVASRPSVIEMVEKKLSFPEITKEDIRLALFGLSKIKPESRLAVVDMVMYLRDTGIPANRLCKLFRVMDCFARVAPYHRDSFIREFRRFIGPDDTPEQIADMLTHCLIHLFNGWLVEEEQIPFLKFVRDKIWQPWMTPFDLERMMCSLTPVPKTQREALVYASLPIVSLHTYLDIIAILANGHYKDLDSIKRIVVHIQKFAALGIEEADILNIIQQANSMATRSTGPLTNYFASILGEVISSVPTIVTIPKDRKDFINLILDAMRKRKAHPGLYGTDPNQITADFIKARYPSGGK